jgi:6-phosphogluconolactonase
MTTARQSSESGAERMRKPNLLVFHHRQTMFAAAAAFVVRQGIEAVRVRDRFLLVISGGTTPLPLFRLLAAPPYSDQLPWAQTHVFWADERMVPPGDEASNYGQAWQAWLQHVPIPAEQVHPIDGTLSPAVAADDYANRLASLASGGDGWPRFDLVLLGFGADGHTASLFPGSTYPLPEHGGCPSRAGRVRRPAGSPRHPHAASYQRRPPHPLSRAG